MHHTEWYEGRTSKHEPKALVRHIAAGRELKYMQPETWPLAILVAQDHWSCSMNLRNEGTNRRARRGERRSGPSLDETLTDDDAHTSGPSGRVEYVGNMPKKLQNASECQRECSKQRGKEYSQKRIDEDPGNRPKKLPNMLERARRRLKPRIEENSPQGDLDELDDLGDETDVSGNLHSVKEYSKCVRNERVVKTNARNRDIGSGGPEGDQEAMGGVERDWSGKTTSEAPDTMRDGSG